MPETMPVAAVRGDNLPKDGNKGDDIVECSFVEQCWGGVGRAIFGSVTAVVLGLVILMMSILAIHPSVAFQSEEAMMGTPAATLVEYYLPYPGILPDSPLYKLKALRDRVSLWVTFDVAKKAEKELLYADKRINAAKALVEGNKQTLGVSTATKAEKYLESGVNRVIDLQDDGRDMKSMLLTFEKATAKHTIMLEEFMLGAENEDKKALEMSLTSTKNLHERVVQALREGI